METHSVHLKIRPVPSLGLLLVIRYLANAATTSGAGLGVAATKPHEGSLPTFRPRAHYESSLPCVSSDERAQPRSS
jgi:hypothetical protein